MLFADYSLFLTKMKIWSRLFDKVLGALVPIPKSHCSTYFFEDVLFERHSVALILSQKRYFGTYFGKCVNAN